jgi:hypothetical protein
MFQGVAGRPRNQIVCEDKLRPVDGIERQFRLARFGDKTNVAARRSEQTAAETLAPVDRPRELDPGFETIETILVFGPKQGTADARDSDPQHIDAGRTAIRTERTLFAGRAVADGLEIGNRF